jgi:TetR/AcrR family transcriptional regulator, transcriptional repressor for nem operon
VARYAADHKEKTREAVLKAAAERLRAGGLEAVGVASIMAEAGLTHGGFYAHFPSRDGLLAAAIERLFDEATDTVGRYETKYGPKAGLERYADFYLSAKHRDDFAIGCPIPALGAETRRAAPEVAKAFDDGLDKLAERLGQMMPKAGRTAEQKRAALALLGEMAGMLTVSRAIPDQRQSNDYLASARKGLLGG